MAISLLCPTFRAPCPKPCPKSVLGIFQEFTFPLLTDFEHFCRGQLVGGRYDFITLKRRNGLMSGDGHGDLLGFLLLWLLLPVLLSAVTRRLMITRISGH